MKIEEMVTGLKASTAAIGIDIPPDDLFDDAERIMGVIKYLKKNDNIDVIMLSFISFITGFYRVVKLSDEDGSDELIHSLLSAMAVSAMSTDRRFQIIKKLHVEEDDDA